MNRKTERIIIRIGGIWNIVNGALTLFLVSPWVKSGLFENLNAQTRGLNYLSENLNSFVTTYCLLYIFLGVLNIYLSTRMEDESAFRAIPCWFFLLGLASFMMVDVISAVAYIVASVMSLAKNKAVKMRFS